MMTIESAFQHIEKLDEKLLEALAKIDMLAERVRDLESQVNHLQFGTEP